MEKEIEIRAKENDSYKLRLKLELNEEDEELLKKRFKQNRYTEIIQFYGKRNNIGEGQKNKEICTENEGI